MQRRLMIAGNWKMNLSLPQAQSLAASCTRTVRPDGAEMLLCPSHGWLYSVAETLRGSSVAMGAQDISEYATGAYTGEMSGSMLKELGCRYVIVGHSERRALFAEGNERVAKKFVAAQDAGLVPLLCLGESEGQRQSGDTEAVIAAQLEAVLDRAGISAFDNATIAYEPVWAIGTGLTAAPEDAQAVHAFIRSLLSERDAKIASFVRILYGGSVKPANAREIFCRPDIDGGLIGGASLNAESFAAIYAAAPG